MLSVITTHVRKSPPELETVLEKIKWLRGNYNYGCLITGWGRATVLKEINVTIYSTVN